MPDEAEQRDEADAGAAAFGDAECCSWAAWSPLARTSSLPEMLNA